MCPYLPRNTMDPNLINTTAPETQRGQMVSSATMLPGVSLQLPLSDKVFPRVAQQLSMSLLSPHSPSHAVDNNHIISNNNMHLRASSSSSPTFSSNSLLRPHSRSTFPPISELLRPNNDVDQYKEVIVQQHLQLQQMQAQISEMGRQLQRGSPPQRPTPNIEAAWRPSLPPNLGCFNQQAAWQQTTSNNNNNNNNNNNDHNRMISNDILSTTRHLNLDTMTSTYQACNDMQTSRNLAATSVHPGMATTSSATASAASVAWLQRAVGNENERLRINDWNTREAAAAAVIAATRRNSGSGPTPINPYQSTSTSSSSLRASLLNASTDPNVVGPSLEETRALAQSLQAAVENDRKRSTDSIRAHVASQLSPTSIDHDHEPKKARIALTASSPAGSAGSAAGASSVPKSAIRSELPSKGKSKPTRKSKRVPPICTFPGNCKNRVQSRGLCKGHGGGKRCKFSQGCDKTAQGATDFCKAHGGGKRCAHAHGCTKSAEGTTRFCVAHGGGRRCQHMGCDKSAQGRTERCISHGGGNKCMLAGCSRTAVGATNTCVVHGGDRKCQHGQCRKAQIGKTGFCRAHCVLKEEKVEEDGGSRHATTAA
jgi:hypothetical protein